MLRLNLTTILTGLCLLYIANTVYHFYHLFNPELCDLKKDRTACLEAFVEPLSDGTLPPLLLRVYTSTTSRPIPVGSLIYENAEFHMHEEFEKKVNITLPTTTLNNGTLYVHTFLFPGDFHDVNPNAARWRVIQSGLITTYQEPVPETFNLMGDSTTTDEAGKKSAGVKIEDSKKRHEKPVAHLRSVIPLLGMPDGPAFQLQGVPGEIFRLLETDQVKGRNVYYPLLYMNPLAHRTKNLVEIKKDRKEYEMTIDYRTSGVGKLRLLVSVQMSMKQLQTMGFTEKDVDEVKGIFVDTNLYLLGITFLVSTLHLLFDVLAFKNDISFWRNKKTMEGLSTKALLWRAFSYTIIFFYLLDQQTSLLVLVPSGFSVLIEYWKCKKALRISIKFSGGMPRIQVGTPTAAEAETDAFDAQAMKWLAWLMLPLCIGGAVYSLAYVPHKSWYSWCIESLANGVYAFGFLFMLPQLFVNYKLKSVAHLPWRAFMYKAFNTFIDDLFAFIITMPTAHRVACFRDDIVFLIYLYQRYLYPVDHTRVNEFGETGEAEKPEAVGPNGPETDASADQPEQNGKSNGNGNSGTTAADSMKPKSRKAKKID